MTNKFLLDLLDELEFRGFDYIIVNGWFEITLGNAFIKFRITDEEEVLEMLRTITSW